MGLLLRSAWAPEGENYSRRQNQTVTAADAETRATARLSLQLPRSLDIDAKRHSREQARLTPQHSTIQRRPVKTPSSQASPAASSIWARGFQHKRLKKPTSQPTNQQTLYMLPGETPEGTATGSESTPLRGLGLALHRFQAYRAPSGGQGIKERCSGGIQVS